MYKISEKSEKNNSTKWNNSEKTVRIKARQSEKKSEKTTLQSEITVRKQWKNCSTKWNNSEKTVKK